MSGKSNFGADMRIRIRRRAIKVDIPASVKDDVLPQYTYPIPYSFRDLEIGDMFHTNPTLAGSSEIPKAIYRKDTEKTCIVLAGASHAVGRQLDARYARYAMEVYKYEGPVE